MTTDRVGSLDDLAAKVDDKFASHRESGEFKTVTLVIDTSSSERPTRIIHVDGKEAEALADEVEALLTEYDAYTQREGHFETDIRVLATLN